MNITLYNMSLNCQALQGVHDKCLDLFGEHAGTMLKFPWQADLHEVANFVLQCS